MQHPGDNTSYWLWSAILSNKQDAAGAFSIEGSGYLTRAALQCPSCNNKIPASERKSNAFYWNSTYGIINSNYSANDDEFGSYVLKQTSGSEFRVVVVSAMKKPSRTIIFSDSSDTRTPIPRFNLDTNGGGVFTPPPGAHRRGLRGRACETPHRTGVEKEQRPDRLVQLPQFLSEQLR